MSKFTQIFTVILIFGVFFAFPASAEDTVVTKADLQKIYTQSLRELGLLPSEDTEGDIRFMFSGNPYFIIFDRDDRYYPITINEENPLFFRIYREVRLDTFSRGDAIPVANNLNMTSRVTKFYIPAERNNVAINTELLVPNPLGFKVVLLRALNLMRDAEYRFFSQLQGSASSTTASSTQ